MTDHESEIVLTDEQRQTLAALADELVPAAEGMPAATDVDVPGEGIDRVVKARPDLGPPLVALLDAAAGRDPVDELVRVNDEDPEAIVALGTAVMGAYYMHPSVRALLGYPGQPVRPPADGESEHYLRDGILDPVRERGPIHRSTPETG